MNWFNQAILAMVILTPCWMSTPFFDRNFGVKPDVYVVWYFFGVALGVASYITTTDKVGMTRMFPSWSLVLAVIAVGASIGAAANLLLFTSVVNAPNPSLPGTIAVGGGGVLLFFAAYAAGEILPNYFEKNEVSWPMSLGGLAFTIIGITMLAFAKK